MPVWETICHAAHLLFTYHWYFVNLGYFYMYGDQPCMTDWKELIFNVLRLGKNFLLIWNWAVSQFINLITIIFMICSAGKMRMVVHGCIWFDKNKKSSWFKSRISYLYSQSFLSFSGISFWFVEWPRLKLWWINAKLLENEVIKKVQSIPQFFSCVNASCSSL